MGLNNIEKKSTGYELFKKYVNWWHNKIYYSHVTVVGTENIPSDKPLIFTANHQNALMDALIMLLSVNRIMVFVARADIFKNPKIAKILYFLKILPIYRVRDGFETVKKTNDIINRTVNVIAEGCGMSILPEGNHSYIRRLRPLKKGFARMAFQAEEMNNFDLDLHIMPVGIYYDSRKKYHSRIFIQFGKPLPVAPHIETYKENHPVALNAIKNELSDAMRPLVLDIRSEEYYDFYNSIRTYNDFLPTDYKPKSKDHFHLEFLQQQKLVASLEKEEKDNPAQFKEIVQKFTEFETLLHKHRLKDFGKTKQLGILPLLVKTFGIIVFAPISLYGILNNTLPYYIPIWITTRLKDKQFVSSFKFVISMLLFPLFYIIQTLVVLGITGDFKIALVYLVSLPLTAKIALNHIYCLKNMCFNWKVLLKKRSKGFKRINELKADILRFLKER